MGVAIRRSDLSRRLAKAEQQVAAMARHTKLANCNCCPQDPTGIGIPLLVTNTKEFEAKMNLPCPVHEFRHLGKLVVVQFVHGDRTIAEESVGLNKVVEEYEHRLSAYLKSNPELGG
jgi:hypothetical protein